jgi:hypothetical protein
MKFRKKPVVIDAIQWDGNALSVPIPEWFSQPWMDRTVDRDQEDRSKLNIKTMEGVMQASPSDWIIRGVKGEIYPCKDDIFRMTYEPVDVEPRTAAGSLD